MVGQHLVRFGVMGGGRARSLRGRFYRRVKFISKPALQRDVKDEPEIEIERGVGDGLRFYSVVLLLRLHQTRWFPSTFAGR